MRFKLNVVIQCLPPEGKTGRYNKKRSFRAAIPGLRFGSGVRFELKNSFPKDKPTWTISFFYGTSKAIVEADLFKDRVFRLACDFGIGNLTEVVSSSLNSLLQRWEPFDPDKLQREWTHLQDGPGPYALVDDLGSLVESLVARVDQKDVLVVATCVRSMFSDLNSQKSLDDLVRVFFGALLSAEVNERLLCPSSVEGNSEGLLVGLAG